MTAARVPGTFAGLSPCRLRQPCLRVDVGRTGLRHSTAVLLSGIFLWCAVAGAEGLHIENGKLLESHTTITLTDGQAEEIDALGTLTLTSDQWARLREKYPACPKRFDLIVPITENTCTCGLTDIIVRFSRNKAAVLDRGIDAEALGELRSMFKGELMTLGSRWNRSSMHEMQLRMDERGQFYFSGMLLPFEVLLEVVGYPPPPPPKIYPRPGNEAYLPPSGPKPSQETRSITVQIAEGADPEHPSIRERGTQLMNVARAAGWEISVYPLPSWHYRVSTGGEEN